MSAFDRIAHVLRRCALSGGVAALALLGAGAPALAQDPKTEPELSQSLHRDYRGVGGLELYAAPGFAGESRYFPGDESNLHRSGFNDRALSVRVRGPGAWQLCDDADFDGRCVYINQDEPDLSRLGLGQKLSSFRRVSDTDAGSYGGGGYGGGGYGSGYGGSTGWGPGGGQEIMLFEHDRFGGRSIRLREGVSNLASLGFNDLARSLRARGQWQLCEHADFEGRCRTVDTDVIDLNSVGLGGRVSSLRPTGAGGYDPGYPGYPGGSVDFSGATQGRTATFFPRPSIGGSPAPACRDGDRDCQRRAASDFCRQAGFRDSAYASSERGRRGEVLVDVLCVR